MAKSACLTFIAISFIEMETFLFFICWGDNFLCCFFRFFLFWFFLYFISF